MNSRMIFFLVSYKFSRERYPDVIFGKGPVNEFFERYLERSQIDGSFTISLCLSLIFFLFFFFFCSVFIESFFLPYKFTSDSIPAKAVGRVPLSVFPLRALQKIQFQKKRR